MTGVAGTTKTVTATVTPDGVSQNLTVTSSDNTIATVAPNATSGYDVTLVAAGSATISFAVNDTVKSDLTVTVTAAE